MAQLDIKNCDFYIKDGYSGPTGAGAVNLMAGYTAGATSIVVDGITGLALAGTRFTVAGDTVVHTVVSQTATLGNTTTIVFSPALGASIVDNAVLTWLPRRLTVRIGEGNLQYTEKRQIMYTKDRGKLDTVKKGDEEPMEVKLDFTWVFLKADSGATPTIEDVLKNRGEAASWISSSSDACEPYAVDLEIVYTPPCSDKIEVYTLNDFRYEDLNHDFKQGQVSVSGKCNVTEATIQRLTTYAG